MRREEFIQRLLEKGFELWSKRDGYEIYGLVTYKGGWTDIGTAAEDWAEWHVYDDHAELYYGTNREVPGWTMCEYCGQWVPVDEWEEHKEDCAPEVVHFDDSSSSSSNLVWIPNLFEKFREVVIYDSEDDEAPYIARSPFEAPNEYGRIVDSDEEEGWVEVIRIIH